MLKSWTVIFSLLLLIGVTNVYGRTDTIPPPPDSSGVLYGPIEACIGDVSVYSSDLPIGCNTTWYVDGISQSTSGNNFVFTWLYSGNFIVELEISCDTNTYSGGSLVVHVDAAPNNPGQIIGDESTCIGTTSYYTTTVGDNETCQWKIDDILQVSDSTTMSFSWSEIGDHIIEVRGVNECGIGNPTFLNTQVFELPAVFLGNDTIIFVGQNLTLNAGNPNCSYLWSTGETTQSIIVYEAGNYEVIVTNLCGEVSDDIFVDFIVGDQERISDKIQIRTINGILYLDVDDNIVEKIQIYNTMGSLIKESNIRTEQSIPQNTILIIRIKLSSGEFVTYKIIS